MAAKRYCLLLAIVWFVSPYSDAQTALTPDLVRSLREALKGSLATGLILDYRSGKVLATLGGAVHGAPGSVIKPILLDYALRHGIVRLDTTVYCKRNLHVGTRALPCTHPDDQPLMDAERALAESCNTWFAQLGRRYSGDALEDALREAALPHSPVRGANQEERELIALGLSNVVVSPIELGRAYRQLLLGVPVNGPVVRGLVGSVDYGMSHAAQVPGVKLLGKTGTASDPGQAWTHGWFAGAVPGDFIVVIYVPHADGGAAAMLAHQFVQKMAGR